MTPRWLCPESRLGLPQRVFTGNSEKGGLSEAAMSGDIPLKSGSEDKASAEMPGRRGRRPARHFFARQYKYPDVRMKI